ncbi:MAG: amidohydrolase family protein [Gammaproteobacteria bacterium]|nr:amidohydrolase family protein [Gammaproteobacteria bacterium]
MRTKIFIASIFLLIVGTVFLLPTPGSTDTRGAAVEKQISGNTFKIVNGTWFDGERWQTSELLIENGRVVQAFSPNLKTITTVDAESQFIIPGLIDAHTHTWGDALEQALKFGVTTELDMFTQQSFAEQARSNRQKIIQTDIADFFSAGTLATSPDGHGTEYGFDIPTIDSPANAADFVQARITEGSDYIKIVFHHKQHYGTFSSIDRQTLKALVTEAHRNDLLAVVHVSDLKSAQIAVEEGANGLVHIFADQIIDSDLLSLMKRKDVFVIPTLSVIVSMSGNNNRDFIQSGSYVDQHIPKAVRLSLDQNLEGVPMQNDALAIAMTNVKKLHQAGIRILAGTDAPNPGTAHGVSMHGELSLLVKSGLSPVDALKAAGINVHRSFSIGERGHLKPGARADLVVLDKDPRTSIVNTQAISRIFKNGYQLLNIKKVGQAFDKYPSNKIADFEQGELLSFNDEGFYATSDQMINGNSNAEISLSITNCSEQKSNGVRVQGSIGRKFPFPWAGAMVSFSEDFNKAYSFIAFQRLKFEVVGNEGDYRLMIFNKGIQRPSEIAFRITNKCQTVSLELNEHANIDWNNIVGFAWVAGKSTIGEFDFILDNIELE